MSHERIIEHLSAIRSGLAGIKLDLRDVNAQTANLLVAINDLSTVKIAHHKNLLSRFDRIDYRLDCIEALLAAT
jgi:hypothetical protein